MSSITTKCSIKNCTNKAHSKDWCAKHYKRWKMHGDVNTVLREYHNKIKTTEYYSWGAMKSRCLNKNSSKYKYYGGRNIRICERWSKSFSAFLKDMGNKPSPEHSIDRVDNNGHYSCGKCKECLNNGWNFNCRWATRLQQTQNSRSRSYPQPSKYKPYCIRGHKRTSENLDNQRRCIPCIYIRNRKRFDK